MIKNHSCVTKLEYDVAYHNVGDITCHSCDILSYWTDTECSKGKVASVGIDRGGGLVEAMDKASPYIKHVNCVKCLKFNKFKLFKLQDFTSKNILDIIDSICGNLNRWSSLSWNHENPPESYSPTYGGANIIHPTTITCVKDPRLRNIRTSSITMLKVIEILKIIELRDGNLNNITVSYGDNYVKINSKLPEFNINVDVDELNYFPRNNINSYMKNMYLTHHKLCQEHLDNDLTFDERRLNDIDKVTCDTCIRLYKLRILM